MLGFTSQSQDENIFLNRKEIIMKAVLKELIELIGVTLYALVTSIFTTAFAIFILFHSNVY